MIGDYLWIGTYANGVDVMDIRTEKIIKHYTIAPNPYASQNDIIVYLYKTQKNNLLVATASGMYQYNPEKDIFEPLDQFPSNCRIQTIFEDHEGVIWLEHSITDYIISTQFSKNRANLNWIP